MGKTYLLIATLIICMASGAFAGNLKALSNAVQVRSAGPQHHKPGPLFLKPGMIVKADFQSDLDKANDEYLNFGESDSDVSVNVKPKRRTRRPGAFGTQQLKREPRHRARGKNEDANKDALNMDIEKDLVVTPLKPGSDDDSKDIVVSPPPSMADDGIGVTTQAPKKKRAKKSVKSKTRHGRKRIHKEQRTVAEPAVRQRTLSRTRTIRKVHPLTSRPWSAPAAAFSVRTVTGDSNESNMTDNRQYKPVPLPKTYLRNGVMVKLVQPQGPPTQQESSGLAATGTDVLNTALDLVGLPFAFVSSLF